MSADDRFWNREELYEEVWTTPMQTLAKKYGISDVGLAKTCRKLLIPLPGRGYWARKEAGQKLERLGLPPLKERIVLQKPTPRPEPPKLNAFAEPEEIAQIEQLEKTAGEVLLKRGSQSHPLIVQARGALKTLRFPKAKSCGLGIVPRHSSVQGQARSCLRIMAGIIGALEDRGFTVAIETRRQEKRVQTVARIYGQVIRFGLTEKIDRVEIAAPPKGGLLERVPTYGGKPVTASRLPTFDRSLDGMG